MGPGNKGGPGNKEGPWKRDIYRERYATDIYREREIQRAVRTENKRERGREGDESPGT